MLLGLLALALVDSINPSAIVVTLYLLSRARVPAQVVVYVAAIFLTYLMLGAMMMVGFDALLPSLSTIGSGGLGIIVQGLIGLALLIYAIRAPTIAKSASRVELLPPLLLLAGHIVFGRRLDARYADLRERLQAGARETMLWIFGLVGGGLLVSSVAEYIVRFW